MGRRKRLPLEQVLLGFLMQEPMHGYDLHQQIEADLDEIWYIGISNVYSALKRLEQSSKVKSTLVQQESHPSRKVYTITSAGEQSFLDWLHQSITTMRRVRVEFPTKLYFFRALRLENMDDLIAAQEAVCRRYAKRMEQQAAQCSPHDINRLAFDFRRRQIEAIINWLQFCRQEWASSPAEREA